MASIYWVHYNCRRNYHLPSNLVEGGMRHNGTPYYICRVLIADELCIGKFYPSKKVAKVPYGGREYTRTSCELLVCDKPRMLHWVRTGGGKTPYGAIAGGCTKHGNTLFVGRAREDHELMPGKIYPEHKRIYVCDDGKEVSHHYYEALAIKHIVPPRRHRGRHNGRHHDNHDNNDSHDSHDYDD